eukprot:TRINITY_DN17682_c0_g1_i1.p1 TRINITY_DN17682_c0_g1~~TRINITY_DN17682_c0_g1_i1.p1  ORF type:complete len:490 (-),score=93.25 TRINITY_DN17682_c0_g1_i1:129-1598(-)
MQLMDSLTTKDLTSPYFVVPALTVSITSAYLVYRLFTRKQEKSRPTLIPKKHRVVIIGGGLGGGALAQALLKNNVEVHLFERDKNSTERVQGYRIHLNTNGVTALQATLPPEKYEEFLRTCGIFIKSLPVNFTLFGTDLSVTAQLNVKSNDIRKSVSRVTLRRILLSDLPDRVLHFNKIFESYRRDGDRIIATFSDGTEVDADILVAADGANSRIRRQFLPEAQRIDTGIIGIAGKVPVSPTSRTLRLIPTQLFSGASFVLPPVFSGCDDGIFCTTYLNSKHINEYEAAVHSIINSKDINTDVGEVLSDDDIMFDEESSYFMWSLNMRREPLEALIGENLDGLSPERLLEIALDKIKTWHPNLTKLISSTAISTVSLFSIKTSVPVNHWETTNITLLGDAIHSMTPYGGTGGNQALKDAELLAAAILKAERGEDTLINALHDYETEMLQRGFKWVKASRDATKKFHSTGFSALFRNVLFKCVAFVSRFN